MKQDKVLSNFIWRLFERFGAKGVEFVVSLIIARLLGPEVFGVVALIAVFINILNVFVDSGFGNALIQKKDADVLDFSSVFYFNVVVCILLYIAMFFAAPVIAEFYKRPELTPLIRVISLTLVISGVKNIQQAYIAKNLLFKKFFFATIGGTVIAAIVGIWMAYNNFGVWALVTQQLVNAFVDTIILWITVRWRPKLVFSFNRLKGLLSYGWKLLVSALLDVTYSEIRQLVIGKFYSSEDLAFYNQGRKYPYLLATNINASIDSVLLPVMSKEQDNKERVKNMTRRSIKVSIYLMAPVLLGMFATANSLVSLILLEEWLPCVPYFRVFCITAIFYPVHTANLNAIKALGRSDIFLKLETIKKIEGAIVLLSTIWFGPFVMACSGLVTVWVNQIMNAWPNKELLGYSYKEQLRDILPTLALSVFMCGAVWALELLSLSGWVLLAVQVVAGILIYLGGSVLLKNDSFYYCLSIVRRVLSKDKEKQHADEISQHKQ